MSGGEGRWKHLEATTVSALEGCSITEGKVIRGEMSRRIQRLTGHGLCKPQAPWWVEFGTTGSTAEIRIAGSADARLAADHPAIRLEGLEALCDGAMLGFHIASAGQMLSAFSISIVGNSREVPQLPWFARIDLAPAGQGRGPCSHPMLHCHVGNDPDAKYQVRVPLPWLLPWEALDWLLATVDSRLEPGR